MEIDQAERLLRLLAEERISLLVKSPKGWDNLPIDGISPLMLVSFLDSGRIGESDLLPAPATGRNNDDRPPGDGHHRAWSKKSRPGRRK